MKKQIVFDRVEVGISDINDGKMRFFDGNENEIMGNQAKLGELIGLENTRIARIRTIYGGRDSFTDYKEITEENLAEYAINNPESVIPISDGLVTKCSGIGILLPLADCLGAVVYDTRQGFLGILHAGRHNIEQYGPRKYIEFLKENYGSQPEELKIYCSPYAINYQIEALSNMTMTEAAMRQFFETGILPENIIDDRVDTVTDANYPSNSAGDIDKRFAIVAKLI